MTGLTSEFLYTRWNEGQKRHQSEKSVKRKNNLKAFTKITFVDSSTIACCDIIFTLQRVFPTVRISHERKQSWFPLFMNF